MVIVLYDSLNSPFSDAVVAVSGGFAPEFAWETPDPETNAPVIEICRVW